LSRLGARIAQADKEFVFHGVSALHVNMGPCLPSSCRA
jgi:hypothetical protein